jgi:hypothetical protein
MTRPAPKTAGTAEAAETEAAVTDEAAQSAETREPLEGAFRV